MLYKRLPVRQGQAEDKIVSTATQAFHSHVGNIEFFRVKCKKPEIYGIIESRMAKTIHNPQLAPANCGTIFGCGIQHNRYVRRGCYFSDKIHSFAFL